MKMVLCWYSVFIVLMLNVFSLALPQTFSLGHDTFPQSRNGGQITFNRQNLGFSHSSKNFNPQLSPLVASRPVSRPIVRLNIFRNQISFHRPNLPINRFNSPRSSSQQQGITFGNEPVPNRAISSNDQLTPINFEPPPAGPMNFPDQTGRRPSSALPVTPTEPVISSDTTGTNFDRVLPTGTSNNFPEESVTPIVFFTGRANVPILSHIEMMTRNSSDNTIDYNNNCLLEQRGTIFDGNCSIILHQGPCPDDHWLILSSENGSPYCAERMCPWGQVYYEGDCVNPQDFDICRRGQLLYVDITGQAECDCELGYNYDPRTHDCFAEHEQGFCPNGYFIERDASRKIRCVKNPCGEEGYVLALDGQCYFKNYIGTCPLTQINILPDSETADCYFFSSHVIIEVSTFRTCSRGSRRDFFHKCRTVFRVPTHTSTSPTKGDCPKDHIRGPRGMCRRVNSLFG